VKFGSVVPGNANVSLPVVQTTVALMDAKTGSAITFFDGEAITKWRTVAASMAAAKELSNSVTTIAIVGVGHQGLAHAEAAVKVFQPKKIILIGRSKIQAPHFECEVVVSDDISDVNEADLIFVCTNSATPVITKPIKGGATCIVIGSFAPNRSEINVAALSQADAVFGDDSQTITTQCGSVIDAKCQNVVSIGDVYNGTSQGRSSSHQVIYYFSVGLGIQDAAMAEYVLSKLPEGVR
jgi:ornithine cyclodeaminase